MNYSDYKFAFRLFFGFTFVFMGMYLFNDHVLEEWEKEQMRKFYADHDKYQLGIDKGIMLSLAPDELCEKLSNGKFDWNELSPDMKLMMEYCKP